MNVEKAKEMSCCSPIPEITPVPTPITIKVITGNNYKAANEIDCVLRVMEAQIFGMNADKPVEPGEDILEAALICTNKLLNSIAERLHRFADRMGVET